MRAVVCVVAVMFAAPVAAQNAATGKTLYKTYCQVCHTVDPSTSVEPFNGIMNAANNPSAIVAGGERGSVADGLDHDRAQRRAACRHRGVPRHVQERGHDRRGRGVL
jgi:mono/diheme cytochrome c family protein